ncbi:MAG TPA: hypothetical protein VMW64_03835 [Dehalococcoidia bacterium]|nr:hypothetical protein [Dehalococcoidia bacterium]
MAVFTIKHHPELTAEKAMEIFKKGFLGKYEVYKWNRPGGVRDFMVKKSSLIGVAVKLKQEKDKTSFAIVDSPPSMFIFLSVGGILYSLLNRSKHTEMMNEVKKFIETEPEFK